MKNLFTALIISIVFIIAGCGSEQEGHSHGEGADHTHEAPAQQSTGDESGAVRIGSGEHSHAEDSVHSHEEEHGHSHDADSTHSHGDEEHRH